MLKMQTPCSSLINAEVCDRFSSLETNLIVLKLLA